MLVVLTFCSDLRDETSFRPEHFYQENRAHEQIYYTGLCSESFSGQRFVCRGMCLHQPVCDPHLVILEICEPQCLPYCREDELYIVIVNARMHCKLNTGSLQNDWILTAT